VLMLSGPLVCPQPANTATLPVADEDRSADDASGRAGAGVRVPNTSTAASSAPVALSKDGFRMTRVTPESERPRAFGQSTVPVATPKSLAGSGRPVFSEMTQWPAVKMTFGEMTVPVQRPTPSRS
jgi:hypothetical protein